MVNSRWTSSLHLNIRGQEKLAIKLIKKKQTEMHLHKFDLLLKSKLELKLNQY